MDFSEEVELKRSKKRNESKVPNLPPITPAVRNTPEVVQAPGKGPNFETLGADSLRQIPDSPKARDIDFDQPRGRSKMGTRDQNFRLDESRNEDWAKKEDIEALEKESPEKADKGKAREYRQAQMLHDKIQNTTFSYWKSSVETIVENSESHSSFGIYLFFLKRLAFTIFLSLFSICQVAYLLTCDFYDDKDIRFGIEKTTLGNLDGLDYKAVGSFTKELQIENSEKGRDVLLSCQILFSILFLLFILYHITMVNYESRRVKNLQNGTKWRQLDEKPHPLSIKEFSVLITSIDKNYQGDIISDVKNTLNKYGGYRGLIEVVPFQEYGTLLKNQLKINQIQQNLSDLQAKEILKETSMTKRIEKLELKLDKLNKAQLEIFENFDETKPPREVCVLFNKLKDRNECLDVYSPYSNWWSKPSKMPQEMKLNSKYGFKVQEGIEPFEINLEQDSFWKFKSLSFWLKSGYILTIVILVCLISSFCLSVTIGEVKDVYNEFPNYKDCKEYLFTESVVVASTTSSTATVPSTPDEIQCFCRYHGKDVIESNGGTNSSLTGIRTMCDTWLENYDKIYINVFIATGVMLCVSIFITYSIKIAFSKKILLFRGKTVNNILVSVLVFLLHSWFIGVYPILVFDSKEHSMPREWYLKTGMLYLWYFFALLVIYPLEVFSCVLLTKLFQKVQQKKAILQKELNKEFEGAELDYSHKIGRLISHFLICFVLSPGLPLLPLIFYVNLLIYCFIEKALILSFYRRMEAITNFIRQLTIQTLCIVFISTCVMSIAMYGNEEIFPTETKTESGLVFGLTLDYYIPESRNFIDKIFALTGIPFLCIIIFGMCIYIFLCLAHKDKAVLKQFKHFALMWHPLRVESRTLDNTLVYSSKSYDPKESEKYSESLEKIDKKFNREESKQPRVRNDVSVSFNNDPNGTGRKLTSQVDANLNPLYYDAEMPDPAKEVSPIQEEEKEHELEQVIQLAK
ncbi:unnamed protein product [Moneuplotes crassus]|uniref:Uncharacterized protein n=1 Tax=Euplotes crassus TaxID=5936 RepID=A0AAD2D1E8_EUPCR|nr:unnamed protein product [Moneuplotes crassus]